MRAVANKKSLKLLQKVADIIESTYDHDEDGRRTNGDSPVSGADVVDALLGLETEIFVHLRRPPLGALDADFAED